MFLAIALCGAFIAILLPIWSQIFDTAFHINESRQTVQIVTEYFVDQEKYFYLISLHQNAVICIGMTTLAGTGTTLLAYVTYACGMFKIASYRMENAMTTKVLQNINLINQIMIHKKINDAVEIHCKAIKFCEFLTSTFEDSFFPLLIIDVISLSLNFYGVSFLLSNF
ncbi:hypothetical protein ACFW04_012298 [Cataglyphis niger]